MTETIESLREENQLLRSAVDKREFALGQDKSSACWVEYSGFCAEVPGFTSDSRGDSWLLWRAAWNAGSGYG